MPRLGKFIRVLLVATAIAAMSVLAHGVGFKVVGILAVDTSPRSVALADLNADGKLDLVVVSEDSNQTVSVFLGNGDGTFQPQVRYAVGSFPYGLAVADVNLDGIPDLIVGNYSDNAISVLLGNGDGTFQPQAVFPTGSGPSQVVVADFNGDGLPDIATTIAPVAVLLGNGDGTFQPPTFPTTEGADSVAVGDFNRDGKLAFGTNFGARAQVQILLGNGDGSFTTGAAYQLDVATPYSLAARDLNHDGKLDLAVTTFNSSIGVLLGHGDGTFTHVKFYDIRAAESAYALVIDDFNRDGNLDVAIADYGKPGDTSVLYGNGDGTFQPSIDYKTKGMYADAIAAGDLNGDGSPDLVVANNSAMNTVSVLLNTGGTRLQTASSLNPSQVGQNVTFTTTVRQSVPGTGVPTGTVTFLDGNTSLGTAPLNSGVAMLTTSSLSQGTHNIVASYSGDTNFNPNTAKPLVQVVNP